MNTTPHDSATAAATTSATLLDWSHDGTLSPAERARRDAMLGSLQDLLTARRRRRVAGRLAAAACIALGIVVALRLWSATATTSSPSPTPLAPTPIAEAAPGPATPSPTPTTPAFRVTLVATDPTILERYAARPQGKIKMLSDAEVLAALDAAGTPGLITINGKTVLSRDLGPRQVEPKPQSNAGDGRSHG
jgi:hypothetical protein